MSIEAWHFVAAPEGIPTFYYGGLVKAGVRLECEGDLVLCRNGYHASREPLEALNFAPGPVICRVRVSEQCLESIPQGQLVSRWREVIWFADASDALVRFSRFCSDQVAHLRSKQIILEREEVPYRESHLEDPPSLAAQINADAAEYHASRSISDPVSGATLASLCARIAFGACCRDQWPERNRVWAIQNDWLLAEFDKTKDNGNEHRF